MFIHIKVLVISIALIVSFSASAYVNGNYPSLATIRFGDGNQIVASSDNLIANAIESGHRIPLVYNSKFSSLTPNLFPSKYFDSYTSDRLNNEAFVAGLKEIVSKFACAEYRFRHGQPEAEGCLGFIEDGRNKEQMPFVDGTYVDKRMEVHIDSKKHGIGYYFYLPSASEKSLNTLWGAVHELGTFFGRSLGRKQLVLTVYVSVYLLNDSGYRSSKPIYNEPLAYFVVLPSALDIYKNRNQNIVGHSAAQKSSLLILEK